MMFMAKFLFPVAGAVLVLMAAAMAWQFIGAPLPAHIAKAIGLMAIVGAAAFVASALAWSEGRK